METKQTWGLNNVQGLPTWRRRGPSRQREHNMQWPLGGQSCYLQGTEGDWGGEMTTLHHESSGCWRTGHGWHREGKEGRGKRRG